MKKMRAITKALLGGPEKKNSLPTNKEKIDDLRSKGDYMTPHERRYLNSLVGTVKKETGRTNI